MDANAMQLLAAAREALASAERVARLSAAQSAHAALVAGRARDVAAVETSADLLDASDASRDRAIIEADRASAYLCAALVALRRG